MLKLGSKLSLPSVSLTGFETPLAEEERAIQSAAHQFARDVLRPLGRELDKLTAEQVVAPGSPYYTLFAEAAKLGMDPGLLEQLPPEMAIRVESMIGEEMGWGDAGLAVSLVVTQFPLEMARAAGNQE
ncbi:MAG: acyl-CoA dehydrogenase, partial [Pseudomonadales bacterium]